MEQQNNTIKNRKGKHLTREERQQIEKVKSPFLLEKCVFNAAKAQKNVRI